VIAATPVLRNWVEALIAETVDAVKTAFELSTREEDYVARAARLCAEFELRYRQLDGRELLAAREAEIEAERLERLRQLLVETDPDREQVAA
jgi:hypothetical protein